MVLRLNRYISASLCAAPLLVSACAGGSSCFATQQKLSALRPGMTYQEVVQVMGCEGTISQTMAAGGESAVYVKWNGPGRAAYSFTLIGFRNGRMEYYSTSGG